MSGALVGRKWRARRWERGFGGELGHSLMAPPLNPTTPSRTLGQLVPAQERRLHRARPPLVPRSGAAITRDLHSAPSVLPRNLVECFAEEDNECLVGFGEASIFCSNTMNFHDAGSRIPKRRRTSYMKSIVQLPDLNSPPAEGTGVGVPTSRMAVSHNQASSSVPPAADGPQTGIQSAPIDVVVIDDDVMIYPPRSFPQTRQRSTRTEPITVIIDDDSETNLEPAGDTLDEHVNTLLSLGINRRHVLPRVSNNCPVMSLLDTPEVSSKPTVLQTPPEPVKDIPKEPKFTCPICLNELTEASSTSCGHIFCKKCIKAAIQAQKKCPTCRKKLSGHNVHRVYLPTME